MKTKELNSVEEDFASKPKAKGTSRASKPHRAATKSTLKGGTKAKAKSDDGEASRLFDQRIRFSAPLFRPRVATSRHESAHGIEA